MTLHKTKEKKDFTYCFKRYMYFVLILSFLCSPCPCGAHARLCMGQQYPTDAWKFWDIYHAVLKGTEYEYFNRSLINQSE
jgi:hypothetical protein